MRNREYERAAVRIREAISSFYGKYAGKHELSYEQAVRALTRWEAQEWLGTLGEYVAQIGGAFGDLFQEGYYHKMYDLQSRAGWLSEFAKVDAGLVESAVNYPWSGAMFSDRLGQVRGADARADDV